MSSAIQLRIEVPEDLARFRLPAGVQHRLQQLLDRQDAGSVLTKAEQHEAEGLVDLAELLSLLRLRAERLGGNGS
jgi:ribosome assembly protein YihI (activator of Der GTPase)